MGSYFSIIMRPCMVASEYNAKSWGTITTIDIVDGVEKKKTVVIYESNCLDFVIESLFLYSKVYVGLGVLYLLFGRQVTTLV